MAWKYQRGGIWWIGYRVNGKQVLRSTKSETEADADREISKLNSIYHAHQAGSLTEEFFRLLTRQEFAKDTLKAFVDQWIKECADLSPVTQERYADALEEFLTHLGANEQTPLLRDVQTAAVRGFLRKKKSETSTATAKLYRKILGAFFNYAVDNEALQASPVPSSKSLKLDVDTKSERRAFTLKELKTLFEKAPNDFWRYMLLAGFYCGQRMGDLICMPWGYVDFDKGVINMVARKTGAQLHIPLRRELRTFLEKIKPANARPTDPIWPDEAKRYEEQGAGAFSNEFYDLVLLPSGLVTPRSHKKTKEGDGRRKRQTNEVSFHCLRHTFVSLLKISGGSQAVAKELAGHSSDAVSDLYTHVPEEALSKAINLLPEVTK